MSSNAEWGWLLNKIVMVSSSFLLGAFFTHWTVDWGLIWQGPSVSAESIQQSLSYYSHIIASPPWYIGVLATCAGLALTSCAVKLALNPLKGMLFDGATILLLASSLSVYVSNVTTSLNYLPFLGAAGSDKLTEALQSIAAANMIIAVSLTGVLALQGAQGFSDRPSPPPTTVKKA